MGSVPTGPPYPNPATPTKRAYHGARTEKEMKDNIPMTAESMLKMLESMAYILVKHGEADAKLISNPVLSEEELATVMKTNTFLTAYAVLLLDIVKEKNAEVAEKILNIWVSDPVKTLVEIAFAEEIEEAVATIAEGIDKLEDIANEGN